MASGLAALATRNRQPELMDQPGLDAGLHAHALHSLSRINRLSRTSAIIWGPIRQLVLEASLRRPLRILDVACGGGDVALEIARRAACAGIAVHVDGCDISPVAVNYARDAALRRQALNVGFFQHDAVRNPLPAGYDVVTCSLFLHHLDDHGAGQMLRSMAAAASRMVVASDLRRSRWGYAMAWVACRALTRSPIVHVDAPLSVAAAFTLGEARKLAAESGLLGARISRHWPQRFLLVWRKPP
jgi:2-polyprenyl-3-methyl-5-hydroxy-6-metoxy-1,4-benzoquinol methylase